MPELFDDSLILDDELDIASWFDGELRSGDAPSPKRDLHVHYTSFVMSVGGSFAHSGSGVSFQVTGNVSATSYYAFDSSIERYGFRLTYGGSQGTGPNPVGTRATFECPILGIDKTDGDAWEVHATNLVDGTTSVEVDDLKIYSEEGSPGSWYVTWDEIRWIVDGVTRYTESSGSVSSTSFTPAGVPFIGVLPTWTPGAEFSPEPTLGDVPVATTTTGTVTSVSIVTTLTGSLTVEDAETAGPEGFPVDMNLPSAPSVTCPCAAPDYPTLTCTNSESISMTAEATLQIVTTDEGTVECPCAPDPDGIPLVIRVYRAALEWITKECSLTTLPDLDREVIRFDPTNHKELIYRYGMPKTTRTGTSLCQTAFPATETGDVVTDSIISEVHPRQSEYLGAVTGTTHAMEDTLAYRCYSPASKSASKYVGASFTTTMVSPEACQPGSTSECDVDWESYEDLCFHSQSVASINTVDEWVDNTDMDEGLDHAFLLCRYVNWWGSPIWSYVPYFPPNTSEEGQTEWPVFEDAIDINYWKAKGDQWLKDFGESRTTLVSDPLLFKGVGVNRWGDATWKAFDESPVGFAQLAAANSALFTITDGTAVFGSPNITLTPDPGETQIIVDVTLGSATLDPFFYAHLCNSFLVGWETTNIDNVKVELVSFYDDVVTLTDNVQGTFERPVGVDEWYAGDYVQDYGCGFITDEGDDLRPNGKSDERMVTQEGAHAFELIGGRTAKYLRFTIDLTVEDDCELHYPRFIAVTDDCATFQLNRSNAAIVWPDGPGIRFGNVAWGGRAAGGFVYISTGEVIPPGYWFGYPADTDDKVGMVPTGLDWLTFRNLFLRGLAFDTGVTSEISSTWDALELSDTDELDQTTLCFPIPTTARVWPFMAVHNVVSVAPTNSLLRRERDADYLPTGTWKQEAHTHAVHPRFHVGNFETHVVDPDDASVWTSAGTAPSPWTVTHHTHVVDNNEGLFQVKRGTVAIGTRRPWDGTFTVRDVEEVAEGYPSLKTDVGADGRRISVWLDGAGFVKSDVRSPVLSVVATIDHGITADAVNVSIDRKSNPVSVWLLTEEGGSLYFRISNNGGYSFGSPTLIGTGMHLVADIGLHGSRYVYWYESGAIKGRRYDATGAAMETAFTAIATADDNSFDVTVHAIGLGKNNVVIDYVVGGTKTTKTSQDGVTFA